MTRIILERIAEQLTWTKGIPLAQQRAQLRETLFVDGQEIYSMLVGSPASYATVKAHEETIS